MLSMFDSFHPASSAKIHLILTNGLPIKNVIFLRIDSSRGNDTDAIEYLINLRYIVMLNDFGLSRKACFSLVYSQVFE